ncbi:hypothetical protein SteCoe_8981 [Stentor coeruleus]|uniref:GAR domain-containing protein n=1 Tax=Stentor coeruleus TaxID=5963 RepID=A0A1R2CJ41_9CILI|nr:hypothetical protein SteCoe_8981 [Stentor coeruleus]
MSSFLNFELTISDLTIPNYSGPIKCALVLANFSTTVSIPCKPLNMVNIKIDPMDKLYLSVFTQSSEAGCLEIPYSYFADEVLDSKFKLYESSINIQREKSQLKATGEVHLRIMKLDEVCFRCEGLEKLVRDIKLNMFDIDDAIHTHPVKIHDVSGLSPGKKSKSLMMTGKESKSLMMTGKESYSVELQDEDMICEQKSGKDASETFKGKGEEKKSTGLKKNPKSKALRSGKSDINELKIPDEHNAPTVPEQDLKKMLEESIKSRQELLSSVNEAADQLSKQLKDQGEHLENALAGRSEAMDQLLKTNEHLKKIQQENQQLIQLLEEKDIALNNLKPKAAYSESLENTLNNLSGQLEKSINENSSLEKKLQESLAAFLTSNNNINKRVQDLTTEKADLLSKLEELIKQNHSLRHENDRLTNLSNELCGQIAILQAEIEAARARENREKQLQQLLITAENAKKALKKELDDMAGKFSEQADKLAKSNSRLLHEKNAVENQLLEANKKLEDKDKELNRLQRELQNLSSQLLNLKKDSNITGGLNSVVDHLSQENAELGRQNRKLSDQVINMKDTIESQDDHMQKQAEKIIELESLNAETEERVASLENMVDELRKDRVEIIDEKGEAYRPIKDDPIDIALSDYVNTRPGGLRVHFDREDHGIYNYGTKKIFVKLEQGKLLIRVGGGFMQVEDFVKMYSPVELERFSIAKKEQAQKIRQSYLGKYADSLAVNKNKREISPERAIKILKDQMASGAYTPYYAVQIKTPERSVNRSPLASDRASRTSN